MSVTACVSAADPERQQTILSLIGVILSVHLDAINLPEEVRESVPTITPSAYSTAIKVV